MTILMIILGLLAVCVLAVKLICNVRHCHPPRTGRRERAMEKVAIALTLLAIGAVFARGEDVYAKGDFTVSPFASYRVTEWGADNGKFGAGLAVGYHLRDNVAIELETLSEGYTSAPVIGSLTEAGANLKWYLPLKQSGLAPYALIGYTRNLDEDQNRMNAGAGIEWRFTKVVGVFADGRWTHDFNRVGHSLFRSGLTFRF